MLLEDAAHLGCLCWLVQYQAGVTAVTILADGGQQPPTPGVRMAGASCAP